MPCRACGHPWDTPLPRMVRAASDVHARAPQTCDTPRRLPCLRRGGARSYEAKAWYLRWWQNKGDEAEFEQIIQRLDRALQDFELGLVVRTAEAPWPGVAPSQPNPAPLSCTFTHVPTGGCVYPRAPPFLLVLPPSAGTWACGRARTPHARARTRVYVCAHSLWLCVCVCACVCVCVCVSLGFSGSAGASFP